MSDDENMPVALQNEDEDMVNKVRETVTDENKQVLRPKKFETQTKLKVTVKGWHGVAAWKWIANDDTCGICRVAFDGCCPDCKLPGDDCPLGIF